MTGVQTCALPICLGRNALLIAGSEGVQYSVRDMAALDRASRKLLERFL